MPTYRASRGVGEACAEPEGAESQLQLSGGCGTVGGTDAAAQAESHRVSSEGDQGVDPDGATDAGRGGARFQASAAIVR